MITREEARWLLSIYAHLQIELLKRLEAETDPLCIKILGQALAFSVDMSSSIPLGYCRTAVHSPNPATRLGAWHHLYEMEKIQKKYLFEDGTRWN